jgi:hypothetical protein
VLRALLFSALVLLSGCVSYSEMQSRVPALEFDSAKAPDVYAGCVAPKLMEIWPGLVTIIPDGQSPVVTVTSPGGGAITATLTIEPIATGSPFSCVRCRISTSAAPSSAPRQLCSPASKLRRGPVQAQSGSRVSQPPHSPRADPQRGIRFSCLWH